MAESEIRVHVVRYPGRTNLVMRYRDPFTGKQVARSTETDNPKKAEKAAAIWEDELRNGRYQPPSRIAWDAFIEKYGTDVLDFQKVGTAACTDATINVFERLCHPKLLADLTTARVAEFARELRKPYKVTRGKGDKQTSRIAKRSEASVARHLRHLKAMARWAHRQGLLLKLPTFDMPKKASGATRMKGRPITGEEFDRMIDATDRVVGVKAAESWKRLLRGLWTSGLRLGEALSLRWDRQPGCPGVILNGKKSVLAFDADSQKSGKVELVPLAPEAVELLTPLRRESGYVFDAAREVDKACRIIGRIGKAAGVVVDAERGKFATAHDLRRAFGLRWSRRVMPAVLKQLMRHSNISTTMEFYANQNAETTATELWAVLGNTLGNTPAHTATAIVKNA